MLLSIVAEENKIARILLIIKWIFSAITPDHVRCPCGGDLRDAWMFISILSFLIMLVRLNTDNEAVWKEATEPDQW